MGYSNTSVASSSGSGRNKVAEVWKRAKEKNISWPIPSTLTNEDLKLILYPELQDSSLRMLPDYKRIHAELAKSGDQMQVDWVGDTLNISDPVTGGTMKAYVFVACLPCSM